MADNEFQLFKCIAEEELVIPRRRLRAHKPPLDPSHRLTPEELEEYESEPVDEDLRDLIKRLLTKNPSKRILLKEVKRHPWVLQGIQDPIHWVEKTDPDLASHGNKIEVTAAEVETAISIPSVVNRIRRAASTWVKGLRKRASSTANMKDKGKQTEATGGKQGQQKSFFNNSPKEDDLDKELQWMGGIQEPREEEKLNELAPSVTNSSTASSETVQPEYHDQKWTDRNQWTAGSPPTDKKLRRKQSMGLLGANLLRRHSVTHDPVRMVRSTHRAPLDPPPVSPADDNHHNIFKAESTSALAAPNISRIIRSVRSDDSRRFESSRKPSMQQESGPLTAREVLSDALYHRNNASDNDTLPTFTPQPRSFYKPIEGIENGMLNIFPKIPDPNTKQKIDRHRREEQEQARLRLGKLNLDDMLDQPCPTSPDDEVPPEQLLGQENRRMMLEERERQRYTSADHGEPLHFRTPEGWSRESFYHPVREWSTPPIAMVRGRGGYFDPPSPKNHLPSSSSDERFVNTAGSSLTNSTSFPSIATGPSSLSSDTFLAHYHPRKDSFVLPDEMEEACPEHVRERKQSELLFCHEEDDEAEDSDSSDSEGGFVMNVRMPKRSQSIMLAELARTSDAVKDAAIIRGRRPPFYSRSSGGTVTSSSATRRDDAP
jgi:serine/threonine protein kinase